MIKRVSITGPESTGKTTLTEQLAAHFNTVFVPDYSRIYLNYINRPYTYEDVLHIAERIVKMESDMARIANGILFTDTDLINIKIWLEYYNWKVPDWINEEINKQYNHYLLMDIDIAWVADNQRNNPNDRDILFSRFESILKALNAPYTIISGNEAERLKLSVKAISGLV